MIFPRNFRTDFCLGTSEIDNELENRLINGMLTAFQEQSTDDAGVILNGFGTVINALGIRVKNHLKTITSTLKWRLNNKAAKVRQQAADLISRIAVVMKACGEGEKFLRFFLECSRNFLGLFSQIFYNSVL